MPSPNTAIEFTPAALGLNSPWDPVADLPRYIARCIDSGERAVGFVVSSDDTNAAVCLPGGGCATIPIAAMESCTILPLVQNEDASGLIYRVAKLASKPDHRLVVSGVLDPQMRVELWGPEIVQAMLTGLA